MSALGVTETNLPRVVTMNVSEPLYFRTFSNVTAYSGLYVLQGHKFAYSISNEHLVVTHFHPYVQETSVRVRNPNMVDACVFQSIEGDYYYFVLMNYVIFHTAYSIKLRAVKIGTTPDLCTHAFVTEIKTNLSYYDESRALIVIKNSTTLMTIDQDQVHNLAAEVDTIDSTYLQDISGLNVVPLKQYCIFCNN
jgi:hypothetical protein